MTAGWQRRGRDIEGPAEKELVAGSNMSTLAVTAAPLPPPVISTRPLVRRVAACSARGVDSELAVAVKAPVAGSKTSAVATAELSSPPPATSTRPSGRSVAVWLLRGEPIVPARAENVFVAGS